MVKPKSTWKTNKLLTGRRNYFDVGGRLQELYDLGLDSFEDLIRKGNLNSFFSGENEYSLRLEAALWAKKTFGNLVPDYLADIISPGRSLDAWLYELPETVYESGFNSYTNDQPNSLTELKERPLFTNTPVQGEDGLTIIDGGIENNNINGNTNTTKWYNNPNVLKGVSAAEAAIPGVTGLISDITAPGVKARKKAMTTNINNFLAKAQSWGDSYDQLGKDMSTRGQLGKVSLTDMGGYSGGQAALNIGSQIAAGASTGASFGGGYGAGIGAAVGLIVGGLGTLFRNAKAKKGLNEVNNLIAYTNDYNKRSDNNRAYNLNSGLMNNQLGAFIAAHGGFLSTQGSDFSTGLTYIGNGGTHESNPFEGVRVGMDLEGTPNFLEEGETIFNDYVFSNRLKVGGKLKRKYKLGKRPITFADASLKMAEEAEERPNDPISQRGMEALLGELMMALEELKARQQQREMMANYAAYGGKLFEEGGNKNSGEGLEEFTQGLLDLNYAHSMGIPLYKVPEYREKEKELTQQQALTNELGVDSYGDIRGIDFLKYLYNRGKQAVGNIVDKINPNTFDNIHYRAYGGKVNRFKTGGGMEYNNGPLSEDDPLYEFFKEYLGSNGAVDFNILYNTDNEWIRLRNKAIALLEGNKEDSKAFREWYAKKLNEYNKKKKDEGLYTDKTADDITARRFKDWSSDYALGFGHRVMGDKEFEQFFTNTALADVPDKKKIKYMVKSEDGKSPAKSLDDLGIPYYSGRNEETGLTWEDKYGKPENLKILNDGKPDDNNIVWLERLKKPTAKKIFTVNGLRTADLLADEAGEYYVDNKGNKIYTDDFMYTRKDDSDPDNPVYYYNYTTPLDLKRNWKEGLRGLSILNNLGQFTYGLLTPPDTSEADSLLAESSNSGYYKPVAWNNLGDYMKHKTFDINWALNNLTGQAAASRRGALNMAGLNRGIGIASALAADNAFIGGLGNVYRQAEEYQDARDKDEITHNADINYKNASGDLQAATSNQSTLASLGNTFLNSKAEAYRMKQQAKNARDLGLTANLNAISQTVEGMGLEAAAYNMTLPLIERGIVGVGAQNVLKYPYTWVGKHGGKLKRVKKKGLTI